MGVQYPLVLIILRVYLSEMRLEIADDGVHLVRTLTVGCNAIRCISAHAGQHIVRDTHYLFTLTPLASFDASTSALSTSLYK